MDYWELLRTMIAASGKSMSQLSREIGKSRAFLAVAFHDRQVLRTDLFLRLVDACGFDMVIRGDGFEQRINPESFYIGIEPIGAPDADGTREYEVFSVVHDIAHTIKRRTDTTPSGVASDSGASTG